MPTSAEQEMRSAFISGNVEKVRDLLNRGVCINATTDGYGRTPLIWASANGHDAVVQLLLEAGAKLDPADTNGKTALDHAKANLHFNIVVVLERHKTLTVFQKQRHTWLSIEKFKTRVDLEHAIADCESRLPNSPSSIEDARLAVEMRTKLMGLIPMRKGFPDESELQKGINDMNRYMDKLSTSSEDLEFSVKLSKEITKWMARLEKERQAQARLEQKPGEVAAEQQRLLALSKEKFYQHFDELKELVRKAKDGDAITIAPVFEKACGDMTDFLQLKYYFTAVNAQYRLDTISSSDRQKLILASLEKAKGWCTSPFHVAMYRVALRYAISEEIISQFKYDELDVAALECDIENTEYMQAMHVAIQQNAARIDRMEDDLICFQKAVIKSIHDLQRHLAAVDENVDRIYQDIRRMAQSVRTVQASTLAVANAFNKFSASMRYRKRVQAGFSLVSAVLNAVTYGVAGNVLQGFLGLTIAHIADFGNLKHLRDVVAEVGIEGEMLETVGRVSVQDMLELGISLAEDHLADHKLDEALSKENAVVVIAASAAVFTKTLKLDPTESNPFQRLVEGLLQCLQRSIREKRLKFLEGKLKRREEAARAEIAKIESQINRVRDQPDVTWRPDMTDWIMPLICLIVGALSMRLIMLMAGQPRGAQAMNFENLKTNSDANSSSPT